MNNSLITHIMPVTFFGGTGGHLLRSLLIDSKIGSQTPWRFSPYGNAHNAPTEQYTDSFRTSHGLYTDISEIMSAINDSKGYFNPLETYYEQFHIVNLRDVMSNFYKSIRICYNVKNIREISLTYLAKSGIDGGNIIDCNNVEELRNYCLRRHILGVKYHNDFQIVEQGDRILCVTWDEILKENPNQLFDKLTVFTGLEKFSLDKLLLWRELTLKAISDMDQRIR
jgi:hypothetical protein